VAPMTMIYGYDAIRFAQVQLKVRLRRDPAP
jgi:hypothetical protein